MLFAKGLNLKEEKKLRSMWGRGAINPHLQVLTVSVFPYRQQAV